MSGLLAKVGDAVRNSPLMARKGQTNYAMAAAEDDDPFNRGLTFHVEYMGMEKSTSNVGAKAAQISVKAVERIYERSKPPFRKFSVCVTDKSLRLKDQATKHLVDDVPLYAVSYCGTHTVHDRTFCFISKDADADDMKIHVMRTADRAKAQAMIVTVSKAFNIAFMAWKAKQKQERSVSTAPGADSPRAQRRIQELNAKSMKRAGGSDDISAASVTVKMAKANLAEAAPTPTIVTTNAEGDLCAPTPADVGTNVEDDLDDMFTQLAEARSHPDLLDTDIGADPTGFTQEQIKDHVDPNSTPNLLDM